MRQLRAVIGFTGSRHFRDEDIRKEPKMQSIQNKIE
jgi:hypothetical protein